LVETTDDTTCTRRQRQVPQSNMSATEKRERWTDGKHDRLCEKYFTPLLTASSVDYLEALYEQMQYELHYLEAYTTTDRKNLAQQKPTAATTE